MKKVLLWGALALAVMFVVSRPSEAAAIVDDVIDGAAEVGTGFGDFLAGVAG